MREMIMYQSSGENELFIEQSAAQLPQISDDAVTVTVDIDASKTYQEMDGFGASFTDSAAYLIHQVLGAEQRTEVMRKLFDPQAGIGLSFLRNPMGASDYARTVYSYNDLPEGGSDPELAGFSIAHDEADIIPLVQQALKLNPEPEAGGFTLERAGLDEDQRLDDRRTAEARVLPGVCGLFCPLYSGLCRSWLTYLCCHCAERAAL